MTMREEFVDYLDRTIPSRMSELHVPGAALAIVSGNSVTAVRCYGVTDADTQSPVTARTRFSLQSISKSFTAWGVMKLVETGQVRLDAPINDYLRRWRLTDTAYPASEVTVRRLLSHHGGISSSGINSVHPDRVGDTLIDGLNGTLPALTEEQQRYYDRWNLSPGEPVRIEVEPGAGWQYANGGFAMLELMVEDVTGRAFADYMGSEILEPLGLVTAGYGSDPDLDASPHGPEGVRLADYRKICKAAGGLYASVQELAHFTCAQMRGYRDVASDLPISHASFQEMFTSHGLADKVEDRQFEAGLGHLLLRVNNELNVHHSGGSIGWRSIYSVFPALGEGFCMLMNSDEANELWIPLVSDWRRHLFS
ncbi:MAG: serine hydrolase domain-containing protein [Pseudomonadales bacterium]